MQKIIIIVDPFSTGALIAPELQKKGINCYAVLSSDELPDRFIKSYTSDGFQDKTLYKVDEIIQLIPHSSVISVIAGSETGVYCAEQLAFYYNVESNDYRTTDWRRKKSSMQKRLYEKGLLNIKSIKISQGNSNIEDCAEQLAFYYNVESNDYRTTDWRRKKSSMQKRLYEKGLLNIKSIKISQGNSNIEDFESNSGYV